MPGCLTGWLYRRAATPAADDADGATDDQHQDQHYPEGGAYPADAVGGHRQAAMGSAGESLLHCSAAEDQRDREQDGEHEPAKGHADGNDGIVVAAWSRLGVCWVGRGAHRTTAGDALGVSMSAGWAPVRTVLPE